MSTNDSKRKFGRGKACVRIKITAHSTALSVGQPVASIKVGIVNEQDEVQPEGCKGEIRISTASPNYRIIVDAERYLKGLADSRHATTIGSYDPIRCQCNESEFFDGMHPRREAIDRVYQSSIEVR